MVSADLSEWHQQMQISIMVIVAVKGHGKEISRFEEFGDGIKATVY